MEKQHPIGKSPGGGDQGNWYRCGACMTEWFVCGRLVGDLPCPICSAETAPAIHATDDASADLRDRGGDDDDESESPLNACRECGSTDLLVVGGGSTDDFKVGCRDCRSFGPPAQDAGSAVALWNEKNPPRESINPRVAAQINIDALAAKVVAEIKWREAMEADFVHEVDARTVAREAIEDYLRGLGEDIDAE